MGGVQIQCAFSKGGECSIVKSPRNMFRVKSTNAEPYCKHSLAPRVSSLSVPPFRPSIVGPRLFDAKSC